MRTSLIYASRAERFLSYLLDTLFIIVPVRLAASFFLTVDNSGTASVDPTFYPVMFLINAAYYSWFTASRWQATPGERLLGIYVIRTDNRRVTFAKALERFLVFYFPLLPFYVSFLTPVLAQSIAFMLIVYWFTPILYTQERTGMHDRLCRMRVLIGKVG